MSNLQRLKYLTLRGKQINDVVIDEVLLVPSVGFLKLFDTAVSDQAVARFRKQHPNGIDKLTSELDRWPY